MWVLSQDKRAYVETKDVICIQQQTGQRWMLLCADILVGLYDSEEQAKSSMNTLYHNLLCGDVDYEVE